MAFDLVKDPSDIQAEFFPISSITVVVGDMLVLEVGATSYTLATSTSEHWQRQIIAIEAATTSETEIKAVLVTPYQLWDVELGANSSASHDGDRMVLTDANTVNNTGSDSVAQTAMFIQKTPKGVAADQRALGYFTGGNGVNPDAGA